MATAAAQHTISNTLDQVIEPLAEVIKPVKHHVVAELNYHKYDGTLPAPYYIG
jgi:hypothetical protein